MPEIRKKYPFDQIEPKWQHYWIEKKTFQAIDPQAIGFDSIKQKLYILDMFPYPSGSGLHVGHPEGYTATDIYSRYKRMCGYNVLHPIGWDAFGLPAEQYAIDTGTHPAHTTRANIDNFRRQIKMLGFSYDWDREVNTTDSNYFKWTQWIFLQLYKQGLAYEAEIPVWWCNGCKAVLANEEIHSDGSCDRKGHKEVYRRPLRQWVLKITAYAERLLEDLDQLNWPEPIKEMQRNWIGRSEGAELDFLISEGAAKDEPIRIFTTRPDTLFGATYMVLAPEHPLVEKVTTEQQQPAVNNYCVEAAKKSELERTQLEKNKTGIFTGGHAINPVNQERIPIWISDYVMMGYGTGAIMAVPAHDERDFEFATKFDLKIQPVVQPSERNDTHCFTGEGVSINSGMITGLATADAKNKITSWIEEQGLGKATVNYKLRDWLFSRQRYWGEPIPIVHCKKCDTVPVPESELPLILPKIEDYTPTASAEPPLAKATDWVNIKCPNCSGPANRETNTMPQWAGSCWYYLRYIDPHNHTGFISKEKEKYWMPIDLYVGGAEHAVLHLLYARFWHKVLFDLGHVSTAEPFKKLINQGMILGEDNLKMSKSRGNVINPDTVVKEYGADAFRMYEMFMGPLDMVKPWKTQGVEGIYRFLGRVWRLFCNDDAELVVDQSKPDVALLRILHQTIKKVTHDTENLAFNTAISQMMTFVNEVTRHQSRPREVLEPFVLLLSPYAPHIAEELWEKLGHEQTLAYEPWPTFEEALLQEDTVEIILQINGKIRDRFSVDTTISKEDLEHLSLARPKVIESLKGKNIKKVVVVPLKLVNIVAC